MNEDLSILHAGSRVIWDTSRYGGESLSIATVDRVTATMVIIKPRPEYEVRFHKKDGRQVGTDSYSRACLRLVTPELIAKIEKAKLVAKFETIKWKDMHLDQLRAVSKAISNPTAALSP